MILSLLRVIHGCHKDAMSCASLSRIIFCISVITIGLAVVFLGFIPTTFALDSRIQTDHDYGDEAEVLGGGRRLHSKAMGTIRESGPSLAIKGNDGVDSGNRIEQIKILGNFRIPTSTILSYMELAKNLEKTSSTSRRVASVTDSITTYDSEKISQGIKKLYATGFFTDISTIYSKGILTIKIIENASINQIAFEGNKKLKDSDLKKLMFLKPGGTFSSIALQKDVNTLLDYYQKRGLFGTIIEPKLVDLPENSVSIVLKIKESDKSKIERIQFLGNDAFKARELMAVILSKETAWYRMFSSVDLYDPDKTKLDEELLKKFYWENGYLDFYVQETNKEISPQKNSFIVSFVLNEGKQYHFGEAIIESSIKKVDISSLASLASLKKGQVLDYLKIEDTAEAIKNRLRKDGYAFADVNFDIERLENNVANVKFTIGEGLKIYINHINILDNVRTLDKVIRREMRIAEGDAYNIDFIERSKQRIINLGYFSAVEISPASTNVPDKADLNISVKEMSTGSLNFNVGYNTDVGALGGVTLSENNLLGTGRIVSLGVQRAQRSTGLALSFTEPYFLNRDMFAGIDLFYNKSEYKQTYTDTPEYNEIEGPNAKYKKRARAASSVDKKDKKLGELNVSRYSSQDIGTSLKVGYELSEYWRQILRYTIKSEKYLNMSFDTSDFLKAQSATNVVSLVSQTLTYDKRDNNIRPTSGYIGQLTQELAGLGGDSRYLQNDLLTSAYFPLYKKDLILNITGRIGAISGIGGKKVRIIDNFFIGDDYIRGFENNGIGPRDKETLDSLGGKNYCAGTIELNFPLGLPKEIDMSGAVFFDAASLYDIDIPKYKEYLFIITFNLNISLLSTPYS